jgi:hypothetical protein
MTYKVTTYVLLVILTFMSVWIYGATRRIDSSRAYYYDIIIPDNIDPNIVKVIVSDKGDFCRDMIRKSGRKNELRLLADGRTSPKASIYINDINTQTIALIDDYVCYNIKSNK